jgi:hypothetical protein
MVRSRQCWFVALAIMSSASMIMFTVVGTPAQTLAEEEEEGVLARPWPCHLTVTGELRAVAELAWEHSSTFRDQCRRLAAAGATMIVQPISSREMYRAQTRIRTTHDGATIAFARVRPGTHSVELIAHELEHVVEYLEGTRLLMESSRGSSRVRLSGGAYETQRAIDAGRRVAQEVRDATTGRATAYCSPSSRQFVID